MINFSSIYSHSPVFIQNIACTIKGYKEKKTRTGALFCKYYNELLESQWATKENIEVAQIKKLIDLLEYCNNNIPYYRELFNKISFNPKDVCSLDDFKRIPILTKEIVRNNYKKLINPNINRSVIKTHTSGSTGKALEFLFLKEAIQYRWAVWFRHKSRFGINPNDRYATFTGLSVIPINQKMPPFWRENYAMRQTIFTMHHISMSKVEYIVKRLNKGGYAYYSGYPSILFSLASLIEEAGLEIIKPPKVIFTGAETLLDDQRLIISRVFKCIVTDQYGFSEGAGNASRCEYDLFHEDYEYGILECVNPVKNGIYTTGEVIGTGFTNLAMPFIRYQVGDTATWIDTRCKCGRHSKTICKVEGRSEDYVITPEGNKILRFDYIFKGTHNVREAQIIQKEFGKIIIRIVKREGYSINDEKNLKNEVHSKISPQLDVEFEYVSEIEREITGKFRAVKSFLTKYH